MSTVDEYVPIELDEVDGDASAEPDWDFFQPLGTLEEDPPPPLSPPVCLDVSQLTNVHDELACAGRGCVVHHPSDHHMNRWPVHWRADRSLAERVCAHRIGHPDPDEMQYHRDAAGDLLGIEPAALVKALSDLAARSIHGCDGCCQKEHG